MKKFSTLLAGVVISLTVSSQTVTDPSSISGYDQQKQSSINPSPPSGQTLVTDSLDYHPGSTVTVTGAGFQPGENVTLQVLHSNGSFDNATSSWHQPWTVAANTQGGISSTWTVPTGGAEQGAHFVVSADGQSSGDHVVALFTDPVSPNPNFIQPDSTYTTFAGNDDGSLGPISLPFTFNLYGVSYTHVYINNNGNLTFTSPFSTYVPSGFPFNIPMVAPYWSDEDTRPAGSGKVVYKVSPTHMIVTWPNVGYYNLHTDKLNTFQVIITNGSDSLTGPGNNVEFNYLDMSWTTGDASGGSGGFGGSPATVGVNSGDNIHFVQVGRFDQNNANYDGGGGANDGVNYLDNQSYLLNVSNQINQPPSFSGAPANNKVDIVCGSTQTISLSFLPPEVGQTVSAVVNTGGLCNTTVSTTTGTVANANVTITADTCNMGTHVITFTATDNFTPPASTTVMITVNIVPLEASASGDTAVCQGTTLHLHASGGSSYSWTGPNGFTSTDQNPEIPNATPAATGNYTVTVSAGTACSAVASTGTLIVYPSYSQTFISQVCENGEYPGLPWGGIAAEGDNSNLYSSIQGCDSLVIIHLDVLHTTTSDQTVTICDGTVFILPDESEADESGVYTSTIPNYQGCDSVVTTFLTVNQNPSVSIQSTGTISECAGGSVTLTAVIDEGGNEESSLTNQGTSYLWSPGQQTSASITVITAGSYSVSVTDASGCSGFAGITVTATSCIFPDYPPPANGKVDSTDLIGAELMSLYQSFGGQNTADTAASIFILRSDSVMVEVIALQGKYDTLKALLQVTPDYGMTDLITNGSNTLIITGKYPIVNLQKLNQLPNLIDYCRPVYPAISNIGIAYTRGDSAQRSDYVRGGYHLSGAGVKVGVLSDSYNTILGNPAATDVANGDLPSSPPVEVVKEYPFGIRTDEGRAMLQIVHDVAPDARLAFRTGFITAGDFAEGIRDLQRDTCDVIVDDVTFMTEPFFQDGVVAKAVDEVTAQGVSYFSAAGNFGTKSYENTFNPVSVGGIPGVVHDFNGSGDVRQSVSLPAGVYTIVLQWEDSIYSLKQGSGAKNDLDIYLTDDNGIQLFGFNRNNLGADPLEILPFTVSGASHTNIMIVKASGPDNNVRFKYVVFRGSVTFDEYNSTGTSTLVGQANADGAMAVGAVLYTNTPAFGVNPPTIASFSSRGGTEVNGVVRQKPDFAAPNGGNTTVNFGAPNIDGDLFPNFFGTSAAAPHAAGVGALLIEGKHKFTSSTLNPSGMRSLLQNTAVDMDAPGYDVNSGFGLIDANAAMMTFAAPTPLLTSLDVPSGITAGSTPFTVTITGKYFTQHSTVLFRGGSIATTYVSPTQLTASIPSFTGNPPIQVYTSPVSLNGNDGGYSNILYFLSPVKKQIVVSIDDKTKKYGEKLPVFTSTITVDGQPLAASGLSLADLALNGLQYTCTGTSASYTGLYRIDSTHLHFDIPHLELYDYTVNFGVLSILKMPLSISPRDMTVRYGDNIIDSLTYIYSYDSSNVDVGERGQFLAAIQNDHHAGMINAIALINGGHGVVNGGHGVVNSDLEGLSILMTYNSLTNGGHGVVNGGHGIINGGHGVVNGGHGVVNGITDTMEVVDISSESIYEFIHTPDSVTLINSRAAVSGYDIVNGGHGVVNGGHGVVNGGHGVVNGGHGVVNGGHGVVNSTSINDSSNKNVAFIIDSLDVYGDSLSELVSVSMITGITVGQQSVVPGAFISDLFDITYHYGNVNIVPAPLVVVADDEISYCGDLPDFTNKIFGFQYSDSAGSVLSSLPADAVIDTNGNVVTDTLITQNYHIRPQGGSLTAPSNYTLYYQDGTLTASPHLSAFASGIIDCYGGSAAVTVVAAGGTAPYFGTGSYTVTGAGLHSYTVTDSKGCLATAAISLVNPPVIIPMAAPDGILCHGGTTCVTVTAVGGTGSYTSGTGSYCGYAAGPATFTVTDSKGCSKSATITITEPSKVTATVSTTPSTCGLSNGSATASPAGGTPGYTYYWLTGDMTQSLVNRAAGSYTVIVSDAHDCKAMATGVISSSGTSIPAAPAAVSGPAGACRNQTGIVYSATPVSGAASYQWTLPTGVTGTSSTNSITVSFGSTFTGGFICVKAVNSCGSGASTCLSVPRLTTAPATPGTISGPVYVCTRPSSVTYAIAAVTNATSYSWTISGTGFTLGSVSADGLTATVNAAAAFTSGNVKVKAVNCIGSSSYKSMDIYGGVPPAPVFNDYDNSGGDNISVGTCGGSTYEYELNPIPGATSFTWTAAAGSIIDDWCATTPAGTGSLTTAYYGSSCVSASTHPEVKITFPSGFTSGNVTVTAANGCGSSAATSFAVQSKPNTPGTITGNAGGICNSSGNVYSVPAVPGATSYTWTVPSGATVTSGSGTASITVSFSSSFSSGNITVKANNACGSSSTSTKAVTGVPSQPGTISGNAAPCKSVSAGYVYSIAAVTGATSYTWTVSSGGTFVGSSTGASVTVKFTSAVAASNPVTLSVKANRSCGSSPVQTKSITVNLGCRSTGEDEPVVSAQLDAYPNPTKGLLNVFFQSEAKAKYILKVTDMLGNILLSEEKVSQEGKNLHELDLTGVASGIYLLSLQKEGTETRTIRITVE